MGRDGAAGIVFRIACGGGDMGTAGIPRQNADLLAPVWTVNANGRGPFAIVVDHASNRVPPRWGDLGLSPSVNGQSGQ